VESESEYDINAVVFISTWTNCAKHGDCASHARYTYLLDTPRLTCFLVLECFTLGISSSSHQKKMIFCFANHVDTRFWSARAFDVELSIFQIDQFWFGCLNTRKNGKSSHAHYIIHKIAELYKILSTYEMLEKAINS
jgi:hypothetical protein